MKGKLVLLVVAMVLLAGCRGVNDVQTQPVESPTEHYIDARIYVATSRSQFKHYIVGPGDTVTVLADGYLREFCNVADPSNGEIRRLSDLVLGKDQKPLPDENRIQVGEWLLFPDICPKGILDGNQ